MGMLINPYQGTVAVPVLAATALTIADGVTTTTTATAPGGIVAGDLLLVVVSARDASGGDASCWITPPAGWTRLGEMKKVLLSVVAFYKIAVGGEGNVTITNDRGISENVVIYYMRITGAHASDPINSMWVDSTDVTSGSYAPAFSGGSCSVDKCLGINVVLQENTGTPTVTVSGAGWTKIREDNNPNVDACLSTKPMNSAGNQTNISYSSSGGTSTEWAALTLAINPITVNYGAYPVLASYSQKLAVAGTPVTSFVITPPSGIVAGNMLVLIVNNDNTGAGDIVDTPSGWTKIRESGDTVSDNHTAMFYKVAAGGESDLTVTQASSRYVAWWLRLTGCTGLDSSAEFTEPTGNQLHTVLTALWPTTTRNNCLLIGSSGVSTGQIGTYEHVYGAGDITLVASVTNSDAINNEYAALFTARAPIAGINAGAPIFHESARSPVPVSTTHSAVAAAFY